MFSFGLFSHQDTLDLIEQTRAVCDNDPEIHCWVGGIPYNYWEQYLWVEQTLLLAGGAAIGLGFFVAFLFLFIKLKHEKKHTTGKIFMGSVAGSLLITVTTALSLVPVVGLSVLAGVSFTAFSDMSFVLSVGFAVEYSTH